MGRKTPSSARKVGIYYPKPTFLTYPEFSTDFMFNDDASKDIWTVPYIRTSKISGEHLFGQKSVITVPNWST